jgi:hypothetical protein
MNRFNEGYALIAGIANYPNINKLPDIVLKDAGDIYELLRSPDYCGYLDGHLRLLIDDQATSRRLRDGLLWLSQMVGENDTALFFFSGHGVVIHEGSLADNYLLTHDCDFDDLKNSAISGSELTQLLRKVKARRLLVLFDACFSGGTGEVKTLTKHHEYIKSGLTEDYYARLAHGKGRVVIASSRANEESFILHGMENSLFSYYLLEALKGYAPTRGDGLIRVFDVFRYVSEQVPKRADQHPIFKAADLEDDFPIALAPAISEDLQKNKSGYDNVTVDQKKLRELIINHFNNDELELLCADIQQLLDKDSIDEKINLDILGGGGLEIKAYKLINFMENRGYLGYLLKALQQARPMIFG